MQKCVRLLNSWPAPCANWVTDMAKRASGEAFEELHALLTNEIIARIKSGEATTADLRAAIDWLKTNDITGVAAEGTPLAGLAGLIPDIINDMSFDDVQRHI